MESNFSKELLSARLKQFRKEKGLTQAELAEMIDVSLVNYAKYEGGQRTPSLPTLVKLSMALGIPLECLLFEERRNFHLSAERIAHLRSLEPTKLKAILEQLQNLYQSQK